MVLMSLKNELEKTGDWLFRYRSYLPFLFLPFLIYVLKEKTQLYLNSYLIISSMVISIIGEIIRILTISFVPPRSSGRNTKQQNASCLNQTGIYSTVRHPLYLGNYFILLGPFIYTGSIYAIIIYTLSFWLYYERIMFAEEAYLSNKFGDEYKVWSNSTPAFIPNLKLYQSPSGSFSIPQILEREYTGICGIVPIFTLLIISHNIFIKSDILLPTAWLIIFVVNTLLYIILRSTKKIKRKYKYENEN